MSERWISRTVKFRVITEQCGPDGFLACTADGNINASGETEAEALENLADMIEATARLLSSLSPSALGPGPIRQLQTLAGGKG